MSVGVAVIVGLISPRRPMDLIVPSWPLAGGLALIVAGLSFRFGALGCRGQGRHLLTTGVYSLCRHPLYLGSILLTFGFCVLLRNPWYYLIAAVYLAIFYPVTVLREEAKMEGIHGEVYREYRRRTPRLLPLGRPRGNGFRFDCALREGGVRLVAVVVFLLAIVEVAARVIDAP